MEVDPKVFQVYYKEDHKEHLIEGFTPYLNEKRSILVENECILDISNSDLIDDATHVGVFSYSANKKLKKELSFQEISKTISLNSEVDIFSINIKNWKWEQLNVPQPIYFPNPKNIKGIGMRFLRDLVKLGVLKESSIEFWLKTHKMPIWCNYWIAKKDFFINYSHKILKPAFDLIESYEKDNFVFRDSNYGNIPPLEWRQTTGFSNYPLITFILERLINIFIINENIKHKNLP